MKKGGSDDTDFFTSWIIKIKLLQAAKQTPYGAIGSQEVIYTTRRIVGLVAIAEQRAEKQRILKGFEKLEQGGYTSISRLSLDSSLTEIQNEYRHLSSKIMCAPITNKSMNKLKNDRYRRRPPHRHK